MRPNSLTSILSAGILTAGLNGCSDHNNIIYACGMGTDNAPLETYDKVREHCYEGSEVINAALKCNKKTASSAAETESITCEAVVKLTTTQFNDRYSQCIGNRKDECNYFIERN